MSQTAAASQPVCATCGVPLAGKYCSHCGEQVLDPHSFTLRHFFEHTALHEFAHVDGKIFRSFRYLLFRPGFLTQEYFAGRRQPYVNPVRLLLTALIVYALLTMNTGQMTWAIGNLHFSLLPAPPSSTERGIEATVKKLDLAGILTRQLDSVRQGKDLSSEALVEKFQHQLKTFSTALSFANVLGISAILMWIYRRRRPFFIQHFIFSLHLAAFVLLLGTVLANLFRLLPLLIGLPVLALQLAITVLFLGMFSAQFWYLRTALLRFYYGADRHSNWKLAGIVVFLFFANSVCISVVYLIGASVALHTL